MMPAGWQLATGRVGQGRVEGGASFFRFFILLLLLLSMMIISIFN
jgi:hypothetical protein